MRVIIATVKIPFVSGGAEIHAEGLRTALVAEGHQAEVFTFPFKWYPPERILDHILSCRLLDVTESEGHPVDVLIGLKFPAYYIPHPRKVLWIIHQYRQAYDLWDRNLSDLPHARNGVQIREAVRQADCALIPEARAVFSNSMNVADRLKRYTGIDSKALYHPPLHADLFYCDGAEDYFFFPSRLNPLKRQKLVLEALPLTREPVRVCFAGIAGDPDHEKELRELANRLKVSDRAEWLGMISEEEKRARYAQCLAVIYPPMDEDYGYVTLEAMLSSKPVITCSDSGGPLEFVTEGVTGLVCASDPAGLASAMDTLWRDKQTAKAWGEAARKRYEELGISWKNVVANLLR